MTTKVTVDAHAGWPVRVTAVDQQSGEGPGSRETVLGEVPPNETKDFYVHQGRKLIIEELERPAAPSED